MKKKQADPGNRGCLFLILGTVLILALMALYVFAVGRITSFVIEARTGDSPAYAVMTAQVPCIIAAFILLEAVLVLQYLPSQEDYEKQQKPGGTAGTHTKARWLGTRRFANILSVIALALVLVCGTVSVNTYQLISADGISTYFFGQTSAYTWGDVADCRVDCDSEKGLSVTFTLNDGKQFEILQNTISDNAAFADRYQAATEDKRTSALAFAADLCRELDARGVHRRVSHMERAIRFYKTEFPEQWVYVSELIRYDEVKPSDDETAAETESAPMPEEPVASDRR